MKNKGRIQVLTTGILWCILASLSFYFHSPRRGYALAALAGLFIGSALFAPTVARAIHKTLSVLLELVVTVITWTLLGLAYYLLISPLGILLRATRSLRTAQVAEASRETYWVDRRPEPWSAARYLRPF